MNNNRAVGLIHRKKEKILKIYPYPNALPFAPLVLFRTATHHTLDPLYKVIERFGTRNDVERYRKSTAIIKITDP